MIERIKELFSASLLAMATIAAATLPFFLLGIVYGFIGYIAYKTFMFLVG